MKSNIKTAQFKELRFKGQKALEKWLKQNTLMIIEFSGDQDLTKIWVHSSGEIIHSDMQGDIWNGKFVNLETPILPDGNIQLWNNTKEKWDTMSFVVEKITM